MRTTLTLDDDVAALLKRAMKRTGRSLKDQVNDALRVGLTTTTRPSRPRRVTRSYDGGASRITVASTSEALAFAEGETFR